MIRTPAAAAIALCAAALPSAFAQVQDVVGSTRNRATGTALAKANSFQVDSTVVLERFETWLDFAGSQNLEFYVYRCPTEAGTYVQLARRSVPTTGGGANWYSSGPLGIPLVCGGHYLLAISWPGTLDYFFDVGPSQNVSFGAYTFAYAVGRHPLPASLQLGTNDQAIYYMRTTTHAPAANEPDVDCVGSSCVTSGAFTLPELGTAELPRTGSASFAFDLTGSVAGRLGLALVTPALLPAPIPIAGSCALYVDPTITFVALGPVTLDSSGGARFAAPIPPDGSLRGFRVAAQGFAIDTGAGTLDTTNALDLLLN